MLGSTTAESLLAVLAAAAAVTPRVAVLGAPTGIELDAAMLGAAFPTRASYREEARALLDSLRMFHDGPIAIVQGEGPDAPVTHAAIRAEALARGASIAFDGSAAQWQARNSREAKAGAVVISGDALGVAPVAQHTRRVSPQSWRFQQSITAISLSSLARRRPACSSHKWCLRQAKRFTRSSANIVRL
jgi:hypothetical protein